MTDREKAISNLLEWAQLNADLNHVDSRFGGNILTLDYTVGDMRIHGITLTEDYDGEYIDRFALTAEKEIANRRAMVQLKYPYDMFDTATTTANTLFNFHLVAKKRFHAPSGTHCFKQKHRYDQALSC